MDQEDFHVALKNTQYDEIMRIYHRRQLDDKRALDARTAQVRQALPVLDEIDAKIASLSVSKARRYLDGDDSALANLQEEIASLASDRKRPFGKPDIRKIIWICTMSARTVKTPDTLTAKNATVSARQSLTCSTPSPISGRF